MSAVQSLTKPVKRLARAARESGITGLTQAVRHGVDWRLRAYSASRQANIAKSAAVAPSSARPRGAAPASLTPQAWRDVQHPQVCVIVTTRNRAELLPIALRSVQMQGFVKWECVVVDDASTDDTVAAARSFAEVDGRFTVVEHLAQRGLAAARNTGVAHATADFVCFLDDDDFLLEDSLQRRLEVLEVSPVDVAATYCDWVNTNPDVQLEVFGTSQRPTSRGVVTFVGLRTGPPFIATSPMLRRSVLIDVGGFDEAFRRAEDSELWHRILRLGYRFVPVNHVGVAYRRSPGSMVLGDPLAQLEKLLEIEAMADEPRPDLKGFGPRPVTEPLREHAIEASRSLQVYKYIAKIALTDVDEAIAMGSRVLPSVVRADIDRPELADQLTKYLFSRCNIRGAEDRFAAQATVFRLVDALVPEIADSWEPIVDRGAWLGERVARGRRSGPRPVEVPATRERIEGAVVLIVEALYHVDEFGPLADELRARGRKTCFMLSPKTVPAAHGALAPFTEEVLTFDVDAIGLAAAVVVLNDWGPVGELIDRARDAGVPTLGKVEGVQDFEDVDTGRVRNPYRRVDVVLGQGPNDLAALRDCRVEVVGSSRLERIWCQSPSKPGDSVLINLNFTYHVLTEHRQAWISSIRSATRRLGVEAGISAHPADRTRSLGLPFHARPFRHVVTEAGVLISRFSTVPFEAMARGVPFIYHNPHGEKVPTFAEPNGAFASTVDTDGLAIAISAVLRDRPGRDVWREFFLAQVDVDDLQSSESRTADVIETLIA